MRISPGFSRRIRTSAQSFRPYARGRLAGFKLLSVLIAPVLPEIAARVARELFGLDRPFAWSDAGVLPARANAYQHLMTRVEPKQLDALFETDKETAPAKAPAAERQSGASRHRHRRRRTRRYRHGAADARRSRAT